jgi:hypothetical protein
MFAIGTYNFKLNEVLNKSNDVNVKGDIKVAIVFKEK